MDLTCKLLILILIIYICDCCSHERLKNSYTFDCEKTNKTLSCSSQCDITDRNPNVNQSSFSHFEEFNSINILKIENCVMNYFPNGFNKSLGHIENLKIIRTQLKGITNENLRQFPELQMLVVQYNDLTFIDDELFKYNKKIKIVNLMHNKLINFNTEKFNEKAKTNINFNTKGNCLENDLKSICQLINERIDGELQNYDTKWQTKRHEKNLIQKIHELEQKLQNQASFKSSDASSISKSPEQRNENLNVSQFDSNIFIIIGTFINSILIIIIFFLIWKFNLKIKNTYNHHQPVIVETVYSQPKNALPDNDEYIYPTCGSMPKNKKISKYDKKNEDDSIYEEIDKDEEFKYIKGVN